MAARVSFGYGGHHGSIYTHTYTHTHTHALLIGTSELDREANGAAASAGAPLLDVLLDL